MTFWRGEREFPSVDPEALADNDTSQLFFPSWPPEQEALSALHHPTARTFIMTNPLALLEMWLILLWQRYNTITEVLKYFFTVDAQALNGFPSSFQLWNYIEIGYTNHNWAAVQNGRHSDQSEWIFDNVQIWMRTACSTSSKNIATNVFTFMTTANILQKWLQPHQTPALHNKEILHYTKIPLLH